MTCREKLAMEHPNYIGDEYIGGCYGCPSTHGYLEDPEVCIINRDACAKCWDREIPEEVEDELQHA